MILGFDTSSAHVGAALFDGKGIVAAAHEEMARGQAERLMPMLEEVLTKGGATWKDLDAIGVGTAMIWNGMPSHSNTQKPVMEVIATTMAPGKPVDEFWKDKELYPKLEISISTQDGDEVQTPPIVLRLQK